MYIARLIYCLLANSLLGAILIKMSIGLSVQRLCCVFLFTKSYVYLQRNDGPYYRPIQQQHHPQYRPQPPLGAEPGFMGSIGNGLNTILNNLFG